MLTWKPGGYSFQGLGIGRGAPGLDAGAGCASARRRGELGAAASGGELGRWVTPAATMRAKNSSESMLRLLLLMVSTKEAAEY